jgi:hypothetical protein
MHFDGANLYSYSQVIGSFVENKKGEKAFLAWSDTYSVTTSAHQSEMHSALPSQYKRGYGDYNYETRQYEGGHPAGLPTFAVSQPKVARRTYISLPGNDPERPWMRESKQVKPFDFVDHEANLKDFQNRIKNRIPDLARARGRRGCLLSEIESLQAELKAYAAFFCIRLKKTDVPVVPGDLDALRRKIAADAKATREREEKRRQEAIVEAQRREARMRVEAAPELEAWLTDNRRSLPYQYQQYVPTALKVMNSEVITSRGAAFPIDHARRGLALVRSVMARGEEWHTNGHSCHLGHYRIERVSPEGTVYAGCHIVPWEAIARIEAALLVPESAELEGAL